MFHVGSASIDWNLVKQRVEELWEEFQLPIWITEFDWNHDGDIAWGDHTQHAQVVEDFYRLMFSQEVLLSHIRCELKMNIAVNPWNSCMENEHMG